MFLDWFCLLMITYQLLTIISLFNLPFLYNLVHSIAFALAFTDIKIITGIL